MTDRPHTTSHPSDDAAGAAPDIAEQSPDGRQPAPAGWVQRLSSVLFIVFCFELGLFLLIYPWTDAWAQNYFSWLAANHFHSAWHEFWNNAYVRGAVSGVGMVNVWIAVTEVFRMFARRAGHGD
jgi:hypothetical protein